MFWRWCGGAGCGAGRDDSNCVRHSYDGGGDVLVRVVLVLVWA